MSNCGITGKECKYVLGNDRMESQQCWMGLKPDDCPVLTGKKVSCPIMRMGKPFWVCEMCKGEYPCNIMVTDEGKLVIFGLDRTLYHHKNPSESDLT